MQVPKQKPYQSLIRFMDLHFPSIPAFLAFFLFLLIVIRKGNKSKTQSISSKLPPGPRKLPLIGNLNHFLGLPHHSLRDLAVKHGPIMHLKLGEVSTIVVSSPKVTKQILKTHDLIFSDRPDILAARIMSYNYRDMIFAPYGDFWRQIRKIFMLELLSAKRVQSFRSVREEEVSNVVQNISLHTGSPINLSDIIFSLSNDITARAVFGKKCKERKAFISCMREVIQFAGGFTMEDLFPSMKLLHVISGTKAKLKRIHQKVDGILEDIITEHRKNRMIIKTSDNGELEEDLVDVLLRLQENGGLEFPILTDNIKAIILDIFTAGSETSSTTVEWAISEMLKNPRVMEKLQAELRQVGNRKKQIDETDINKLNYLQLVIKETLRLHPAAPLLVPRECRETCEIDGYEIPMKTKVIVNQWAVGRDPELWNDAERFEPERFNGSSIDYKGTNFEFIPFGAGRRICPGLLFGIANVELQLAHLLYHFEWKLPNGIKPENLDMTEAFGATVRRRNDLYVIPIPNRA